MHQTIIFFALLVISLVNCDMWMHVTVQQVDRKPCPTDETSWGTETTGCASMSYMTLDERMMPQHERRSSSFEHINGVTRPTVTHWPKGRIADWMMSIQFISVDPVYGLARTCDRSGYIRVFQNESTRKDELTFVETTLTIQGQCFTASVRVQASHEICPWCVDETKTTTTSTSTTTVIPSTTVSQLFSSENSFLVITMLILAFFSFLALISTAVLLVVYVCDRRKNQQNNHEDLFEMPPPQANSTSRFDSTCPFTTKSSERWTEYSGEPWASFRPLDYVPPKETLVYKVIQQEEEDSSSDSGNGSI